MNILARSALGALALAAPFVSHATGRFDEVAGRHRVVCAADAGSPLAPVYVQAPVPAGRAGVASDLTLVYRKSFAETVYLGVNRVGEGELKSADGSTRLIVIEREGNTEDEFRAEFTTEGQTYPVVCRRDG